MKNLARIVAVPALLALLAPPTAAQEATPLRSHVLVNQVVSSYAQAVADDPPPPSQTRRWSAPRLGIGAGIAAFGAWYAFSEMRCRLHGNLNGAAPNPATPGTRDVRPSAAPRGLATLQIAYGSARAPRTAWGGSACSLDWDYSSEEWWSATVGNRKLGPTRYPDPRRNWSTTDPPGRKQDDHQPADAATLERMRGTVQTESYRPPEKFYPGLAAVAVGAVIAALFGRVDGPLSVDVNPDSAALVLNMGF